jgi:hypothetical protein
VLWRGSLEDRRRASRAPERSESPRSPRPRRSPTPNRRPPTAKTAHRPPPNAKCQGAGAGRLLRRSSGARPGKLPGGRRLARALRGAAGQQGARAARAAAAAAAAAAATRPRGAAACGPRHGEAPTPWVPRWGGCQLGVCCPGARARGRPPRVDHPRLSPVALAGRPGGQLRGLSHWRGAVRCRGAAAGGARPQAASGGRRGRGAGGARRSGRPAPAASPLETRRA